MGKNWWQSRTLWLGVLQILGGSGGIIGFISGLPADASLMFILSGIVTIVLRFLTNQPIGPVVPPTTTTTTAGAGIVTTSTIVDKRK